MNWEKFLAHKEFVEVDEDKLSVVSEPLTEQIEDETCFWELLVEYTLHNPRCLGMAGVQVGLPYRGFYLCLPEKGELYVRNPTIIDVSETLIPFRNEGCMSFPGAFFDTLRPAWVVIKDDINDIIECGDPLVTACIMHEMDHLDGKLFFDHKTKSLIGGPKVGRNEPCPYCIEMGKKQVPKFKKCRLHFA